MRFPLRLSAELSFRLASNAFLLGRRNALVIRVDSAELAESSGRIPNTRLSGPTPFVWIAGNDPLSHPELPRITCELLAAGRFVFLHTAGADLGRRIHEFQPVSRLHWVVPFDCGQNSSSIEALRRVKLSGFFVCAHTQVCADSKLTDLTHLRDQLRALDVDGWVISAEHTACGSTLEHARLRQKVEQAKALIPSWGWRFFSGVLDSATSQASAVARAKHHSGQPTPEEEASSFQESVGAP